MKKNLRILALCLVSMFAVNCSSDDNSIKEPGKEEVDPGIEIKELKVIDNFVYSSYDKEKHIEDVTTTFFYNEDGTVNNTEEITKSFDGKNEVEKEILTYTYENNLPFAMTLETYTTDKKYEYWDLQYIYENNRIVKADAITDKTEGDKSLYSFYYNPKGQLIQTKNSTDKTDQGTTYKYDDRGNLIEVNSNGMIELITYDDKKSPYTNMNISDQAYSIEFFETEEQFLIRSPHNVTGTTFDYKPSDQTYNDKFTHQNTYDKEGYLKTSTVLSTVNNRGKVSEIKYTYKTIKVLVKK